MILKSMGAAYGALRHPSRNSWPTAMAVAGLFTIVAVCSGCGGGRTDTPKTVPVSGTVSLDGQPVEGASVYFVSQKFAAHGRTGPDGKYELTQGAVAGENKVYITKLTGENLTINPDEGIDEGQLEAMREPGDGEPGTPVNNANGPKELIPPQFSDSDKSKLKFTVPESGATNADFRLTTSG